MTASDYQVNFPYGATSAPYSAAHPHRGDDRPCPAGTPIVINGTTIGLTGATGYVTGPHLHIQEWNGSYSNTRKPQNAFVGGKVVNIDPAGTQGDGSFGKFITIQTADGWCDSYCHLSQINVSIGQNIGGVLGYQRTVGVNGVNYRSRPDTSADIIKDFQPGEVLDFKGYVRGGIYNGNNIWFVGKYTGGYCWSGAFTDIGTHDLQDLTEPVTPPPAPEPTPTPTPGYGFTKDLDCVTEVIPAAEGNFQHGNFPAKPQKVVIHEFGTKGVDTIGSTINHFSTIGVEVSAHFVVSGKRIVQMVSLADRAYHAGPNGNDFVGIESDPYQDADTVASVVTLLKQLKAKYGYTLTPIKHSSIMNTLCGQDIDLNDYQIDTPTPDPGTVISPTVGFTDDDRAMLKQVSQDVEDIRAVFK